MLLGLVTISCNRDNDTVTQTQTNVLTTEVFDLKNASFSYDSTIGYYIRQSFSKSIYSSDQVLVYRMNGTSNGNPVWQLMPRTLYLTNNREIDYDYDFTVNDIQIYAGGNYDLSTTPEYLKNQTFRLVIVPGKFSGKNSNSVNVEDYNAVIQYYHINDKNPSSL